MIAATLRIQGMNPVVSSEPVFRFGLFELDVAGHTLTRKGVRVRIQNKAFCVLVLLLKNPGKTITREELHRALWPEGTYVDFDTGLNVVLKKLRATIDDDSDNPRFIETVPRRGYRFIAPVSVDQHEPLSESAKPTTASTSSPPLSIDASRPARKIKSWPKYALAVAVLAFVSSGWYLLHHRSVVPAAPKVIAVLPFSNEGAGPDFDYLRYAIANDLVTDLTYAQSVAVRPFSSTSRYGTQTKDPVAVGKELGVTHVLGGGFFSDQKTLRVNLELIDVAHNQTVWSDEVTVAPQELVTLHDKLEASTSQRLLAAMKVTNATANRIPKPNNEEAFDLFLHSLGYPLDPGLNLMAIKTLEDSVALDNGYAPAWDQLSWRYYIDERYGNGGATAAARASQAYERLRELDPNAPPISTTLRTEQGDLNGAYDQAADFLRRRPDSSMAHFWMSYVLRYAGLLDEAGSQCDAAHALDPGFSVLRSCATTFGLTGHYNHAEEYIKVDEGSGFAALSRMEIALRTRDTTAALAEANKTAQLGYRNVNAELVRVCLSHPSGADLDKAVAEAEADPVSARDPELMYRNAEAMAFCGQPDAALRQLSKAIKGNYCSYPAMDNDPLFDSLRQRSEFAELRQSGMECQINFLNHRKQVDASLTKAQ